MYTHREKGHLAVGNSGVFTGRVSSPVLRVSYFMDSEMVSAYFCSLNSLLVLGGISARDEEFVFESQ